MSVTVTIWWRAILLNAFITGVCSVFSTGAFFVIIVILLVVGGFLFTLPLLPVISLIIRCQRLLPYSNMERLVWLNVMLLMMVWAVYLAFIYLTSMGSGTTEPIFYWAGAGTSLAVLIAVAMSKRYILDLNATCLS